MRANGPWASVRLLLLLAALDLGLSTAYSAPRGQAPRTNCGPPNYCARTDTRIEPASPPALGPAGTTVKDPTFGSPILRVTDANTLPGRPGISFHTDASSEANTWNKTSTLFLIGTTGGHGPVFAFDPAAMKARYTGIDLPLPPASMSAGEFSAQSPNIIYGWSAGHRPRFMEYDLSHRGGAKELHDPAKCVDVPAASYGLDLSVSGDDIRLFGTLGPRQDDDELAYVYDLKLGCRWYDTRTGEVGGEWGPKGTISTEARYLLHNGRMSKDGKYVALTGSHESHIVAIWRVESLQVELCPVGPPGYCGGHRVMGYSHLVNTAGYRDSMDVRIRPLDNLRSFSTLIQNLPPKGEWPDKHWSWNNANPADTTPVCGTTYLSDNSGEPGALLKETRAWDNEVICIETDGKGSKVWRFAHTFSSVRNGFWSTPRGNVSQDGRFYTFTSDWMNTLGRSADGKGYRTDVFVVKLE